MIDQTLPREQIASPTQVWQAGLLAAVIASVGNLIVYFIANAAGMAFNLMPADVPAPPFPLVVVMATFIGILLATLVFSLMPRITQRPISMFRIVGGVALVLSFLQPLLLTTGMMPLPEPVSTGTVLVLELMHVIAGVTAIYLLTTRARA